ncbi:GRASP55/65 PDZ-like domain-domain-containing protein [Syncephalastrum racemosum]|uniref:GRASP55/65 PDZ-like domain-domain-containing protein n=1 Tax=Syncephalastrum racemosum TaxID=13706 RepID=A0A1X2H5W1_SYNRA|nr:GRASP55/65 PDZ-like domain-domain-containing protein [Syncephalastrum racemosum]
MAGILPHSDYIIGSPHQVLRSEDDFYTLVEDYLGKPLRLYVYNTEWDSCREAIIVPNHDWGGEGSLGCDVGYGLLHRIPSKQKPKEAQEQSETGADSQPVYSNTIFNTPEFDSPVEGEQPQQQQQQQKQQQEEQQETRHIEQSEQLEDSAQPEEQPQPQQTPSTAPQQQAALPDQEALLREAQNTKLPESPIPATHQS